MQLKMKAIMALLRLASGTVPKHVTRPPIEVTLKTQRELLITTEVIRMTRELVLNEFRMSGCMYTVP